MALVDIRGQRHQWYLKQVDEEERIYREFDMLHPLLMIVVDLTKGDMYRVQDAIPFH